MDDEFRINKLPFSSQSSRSYPTRQSLPSVTEDVQHQTFPTKALENNDRLDSQLAWVCHRGILVYYGKKQNEHCLCPPSYYGNHCQYQSQRVSQTLRFRQENLDKLDVIGIIITLVDDTGCIHSHEQLTYISIHDCNGKFNIYLFYRNHRKDMTKKYTVHIDAYDEVNLNYLRS
ncbi:unnamed protein product [Rotaria magnacalcarata]|nr:unnamed protein product [Rotaria magnacalcarata]